jgi:diaminobutyrate-2-oxoglutarate transaminase
VDEIQAGLGRTGRTFAFEHYGLTPDLITVSKGVGCGFPMSLLLFHRRLDTWRPGQHIGTFRGQHYALAAGRAVLRTIQTENLAGRAEAVGARLRDGLLALAGRYPFLAEVRGLGLYLGVELGGHGGLAPGQAASLVQARLLEEGVVAETGWREGAVLRLLPPLTIGPAEADQFLVALERALANVAQG